MPLTQKTQVLCCSTGLEFFGVPKKPGRNKKWVQNARSDLIGKLPAYLSQRILCSVQVTLRRQTSWILPQRTSYPGLHYQLEHVEPSSHPLSRRVVTMYFTSAAVYAAVSETFERIHRTAKNLQVSHHPTPQMLALERSFGPKDMAICSLKANTRNEAQGPREKL